MSFGNVFAASGLAVCLASGAMATDFEIVDQVPYSAPMSPLGGNAKGITLTLDKFNDLGGLRQLKQVCIELEVGINADVTAENDSELAAPELMLNFTGNVQIALADDPGVNAIALINETRPGSAGPSNNLDCGNPICCNGTGPDFFDFGNFNATDNATEIINPPDTAMFISSPGDTTFDVDISGTGGFTLSGTTDSCLNVDNFMASGFARVVYKYTSEFVDEKCYWENGEFDSPAGFDGVSGQASATGSKLPETCAADDFYLPDGKFYRLDEVCGTMLTNSTNPQAFIQIFNDCDGKPSGEPIVVSPVVAGVDTGVDWFGLNVYEFCADLSDDCWLRGGMTYWVSVVGVGDGTDLDVYYFATADQQDDLVQLNQGHWKVNDGPWLPLDLTNVKKRDLAFAVCVSACPILCDNGDFDTSVNPMPSAISLALPDRRAADNFTVPPCEEYIVDFIQVCVLTNCACGEFSLEIYDTDEYMCPGNLVATFGDPKVIETGVTLMTDDGFMVDGKILQFRDLALSLPPGKTYWVSAIPSGTLSATDRTFFCFGFNCRKECQIKGMEAKYRRDLTYAEEQYNESLEEDEQHLRIHEWNPISGIINDIPRDLSFIICGEAKDLNGSGEPDIDQVVQPTGNGNFSDATILELLQKVSAER